MKTFCKRHERFFDDGASCDYCVPGPAKVDAAKVFENMKVPYSGPEAKLAHAGNCPLLSGHRCGCGAAPNKPPYASPTSGCMCGETYIGDLLGPLDHKRTPDAVHHRGDRCWVPAPFPFPPLPPPGSDEALEEMRRSMPSMVAPGNALVRMVNQAKARNEAGRSLREEFTQTLKGMFPPGEEQIENATYVGIDRFGLRYPQWKSAFDPPMSIEQAMKEAWALLEREGRKPDVVYDPSPKLLRGMPLAEPAHDPETCKICRTINERPAPQQQKLTHDWDLNQDVCRRCRKTGTEMAATPAFKSCVETPSGTYKPSPRRRPPMKVEPTLNGVAVSLGYQRPVGASIDYVKPPPPAEKYFYLHPRTVHAIEKALMRLGMAIERGERRVERDVFPALILRTSDLVCYVVPNGNMPEEGTDVLVQALLANLGSKD
jgi:hypothetical protein